MYITSSFHLIMLFFFKLRSKIEEKILMDSNQLIKCAFCSEIFLLKFSYHEKDKNNNL